MTQPQPNTSPPDLPTKSKLQQHSSTPIGNVLNKYAISLMDLSVCIQREGGEYHSKTTLHRMVTGRKLSKEMRDYLRPLAARCISRHLVARGMNKAEIDTELARVFTPEEYQPMISKRNRLNIDEVKHFGLSEDPFKKYPESREEVFVSPALREIFDEVLDAINYQQFVAVIGPIGSGKSTLRDMLHDHVGRDERLKLISPFFMDQSKVTPIGIASEILKACDVPRPPSRATALGAAVVNTLRGLNENGYRISLDFDECHKMNESAIRSLKNFLEMSSGGFKKYLAIVLFGWPSFVSDLLARPEFQEIYERLHVLRMPDFRAYAAEYLAHRLKLAGCPDVSTLFDDDAISFICSQAETPLGLGNIANEALRITRRDFDEKKVTGAAIRTKMHFDGNTEPGFRRR